MEWGHEVRAFAEALLDEERQGDVRRRMFARAAVNRIGRELKQSNLHPLERKYLESAQRLLRLVSEGIGAEKRPTPPRLKRTPAPAAADKKKRRRRRRWTPKAATV
jgi:hypothetical protein